MRMRAGIRGAVKRLPYVRDVAARIRSLEVEQARLAVAFERKMAARESPEVPQSWFPAGHYYSPIPALDDLDAQAAAIWPCPPPPTLPGIDLNEAGQLTLLDAVASYYGEQPFSAEPRDGLRYGFVNEFYSYGDALYLYGLLRHLRPRRVIEIGSGHSSAVTLDTAERFLGGAVACTFVDPEPERLYSLLTETDRASVEVIARRVQDVPLARFAELAENDILFIDGSHVSKVGSDVNHLVFKVLPLLHSGVYIHVHDVFYPFEYPRAWLELGFMSNEAYVLRAFLMYNHAFEVALFGDYLAQFHREQLSALMPLVLQDSGCCLWLRRL
jgi:Methyltransferase domain